MYQSQRRYHSGVRQSGSGFIVAAGSPPPSFPVNGILDNFNRADTGPPPSANWTTSWRASSGGFLVSGNTVRGNAAGDNSTYWNVQNFGPDVEVYGTIIGSPASYRGVAARLVSEGTAGVDGYEVVVADNTFYITRWDNDAQTTLGASIAQSISDGDSFGMSIVGSTITAYHKPAAGSWTVIGTRTDSTYSAAGKIGLRSENVFWDDFGGGSL